MTDIWGRGVSRFIDDYGYGSSDCGDFCGGFREVFTMIKKVFVMVTIC
jgi:hypothetical protein